MTYLFTILQKLNKLFSYKLKRFVLINVFQHKWTKKKSNRALYKFVFQLCTHTQSIKNVQT